MTRTAIAIAAAISSIGIAAQASAAPLSMRDSFRIGTGGTVFCSAQSSATDKALTDMFNSGYSLTCRDAALPIGKMYKLRNAPGLEARLSAPRNKSVSCSTPTSGTLPDLGSVEVTECKLKAADVAYRVYQVARGKAFYSVEGLAGYDSVLQLGLRSLVADRQIAGEVSVATTGLGDPAAFARVQAGTLDPTRALSEAYRRNNAGSYAEAAEFFAAVSSSGDAPLSRSEALANEALQKSNLGRYAEADTLFARAAELVGSDAIVARRLRNYRAMHLLNQGDPKAALDELGKPLPAGAIIPGQGEIARLEIDSATSRRLNSESKLGQRLGNASDELLPLEKAEILDGQALQLRGTALRLNGDMAAAVEALQRADAKLESVRSGRVRLDHLDARADRRRPRRDRRGFRQRRRGRSPLPPGRHVSRGQLPQFSCAVECQGAARGISRPNRPASDRRDDVPRHRPFAARREQLAPLLRICASTVRRHPAAEERPGVDRGDLRCDPVDDPSGPCANSGRAGARAHRRHQPTHPGFSVSRST